MSVCLAFERRVSEQEGYMVGAIFKAAQRQVRGGRRWWRWDERSVHEAAEASDITLLSQTLKIASLVKAFRSRGHFVASLGMTFNLSPMRT